MCLLHGLVFVMSIIDKAGWMCCLSNVIYEPTHGKNQQLGFPTKSDTNRPAQLQKKTRIVLSVYQKQWR